MHIYCNMAVTTLYVLCFEEGEGTKETWHAFQRPSILALFYLLPFSESNVALFPLILLEFATMLFSTCCL